jgi:deoxycitidine kinase
MSAHVIINIEGNIGTGKSTILSELKKTLEIKYPDDVLFLTEPVDKWDTIKDSQDISILKHFYQDSNKYAFPFQIMACCTRISNLKNAINNNPNCKIIICERSIEADANIFAQMLYDDNVMNEMEHKIYRLFYDEHKDLYKANGYIYLDSNADVCLERIKMRSRDGESNIPIEYLQKCQKYHDKWLKNTNMSTNVLILDTNKNVTYNNDDGNVWITKIVNFINDVVSDQTL